jgi:drug/metabolite transporter (DMT)-like permease
MALGLALALVTSVCWALGNVCIQKSGRALGAARAMVWALAVGAVAAGIMALLLDRPAAPFTGAVAAWVAVAAVTGLAAYACLFHAFAHAPLSLAVPFVSSWSVVAAAFSIAALGERPRPAHLAGAALVVAGVLLVSSAVGGAERAGGPPGGRPAGGRRALLAAAGSGVSFGVMVPAMGEVTAAAGAFGTSALVYAVGLALGVALGRARGVDLAFPPARLWPLLLLTGAFETAGFVAVSVAGQHAPMAIVAPAASLAAPLTVLYGWLVLRERPGPRAGLGAALACAGVVVLAFV